MIRYVHMKEVAMPVAAQQSVVINASLNDAKAREQLSAPGFRALLDTATFLNITVPDALRLLGDLAPATYYRYVSKGAHNLNRDTLERISLVLGITKALRLIFVDDEAGRRWFHAANADVPFDGRTPLAHMLQGSIAHLYAVRAYLDAWRGGWP